eukprot:1892652-Pyramimonas_sp.AAC.1
MQRLVLDCRQCNFRFAPPPHTELGGLSSLSDLEIPVGQALFWAEGDIKDCFYECGISDEFSDFFAFEVDAVVRDLLEAGVSGELLSDFSLKEK